MLQEIALPMKNDVLSMKDNTKNPASLIADRVFFLLESRF